MSHSTRNRTPNPWTMLPNTWNPTPPSTPHVQLLNIKWTFRRGTFTGPQTPEHISTPSQTPLCHARHGQVAEPKPPNTLQNTAQNQVIFGRQGQALDHRPLTHPNRDRHWTTGSWTHPNRDRHWTTGPWTHPNRVRHWTTGPWTHPNRVRHWITGSWTQYMPVMQNSLRQGREADPKPLNTSHNNAQNKRQTGTGPGPQAQEHSPTRTGPGPLAHEHSPTRTGPGPQAPEHSPTRTGPGLQAPEHSPTRTGPGLQAPEHSPTLARHAELCQTRPGSSPTFSARDAGHRGAAGPKTLNVIIFTFYTTPKYMPNI